ncbi:hypothetical protein [Corynebacterium belfantii]|uniref:hypothetical protein n=1 Tax=Corynebacterium belfantii TaxID=2014537 RepID=UPI000DFE79F9|nr:hypothetical protein [Corynebacterium belfantii]STC66578.1 integral membrane protein [Corynebacterium diphtheriae]MBG9288028.1 hypothetical protein [Corynebacterium belfantii]MBG9320172.1 hypothetical protein [Corynebacterium belfantii]MBG9327052.1 hypothetical protein [Corynebacterium belfantii]MBG9329265.1 hypothetical protein [Corynebacterium belfantii]
MTSQSHKFLEYESALKRAYAWRTFLFALLYGCGLIAVALGYPLVVFLVWIAIFIPFLIKASWGIRLGRQVVDDAPARWRKCDKIFLGITILMPSVMNIVRDLSRAGAVVLAVIVTVLFYFLAQSWYGGFKDTAELVCGDSDECIELTDDQLSYLAVLWFARCAVGFQEMKLTRLAKETRLSHEVVQKITQIFISHGIVSVFEEYGSSGRKDVAWVQLTERGCSLVRNYEKTGSVILKRIACSKSDGV